MNLRVLFISGLLASVVGAVQDLPAGHPELEDAPGIQLSDGAFRDGVDLVAFGELAVHTEGRLKSFDSFATEKMDLILGRRGFDEQTPAFTYLDMMFRPDRYRDTPAIYVKNPQLRSDIVATLSETTVASRPGFTERMAVFEKRGMAAEQDLRHPAVSALLEERSRDLIRTARFVNMIDGALYWKDPNVLVGALAVVAPPQGDESTPWISIADLVEGQSGGPVAFVDEEMQSAASDAFLSLMDGWRARNLTEVNGSLAALATLLPTFNPSLYPEAGRLSWESWYFSQGNMTWIWLVYMASVVFLLLAVAYRWQGARRMGMGLFLGAFALHTFALGLRWYVSQRWPNSNMFEAVTTAAWFGGCAAVLLEWLSRRKPMANLFALASASASMAALMAADFLPLQLNPNIGNMMPVLNDVWLYIHTNVIIMSYCVIFMAAISGILYLGWRALGNGPAHVRTGGAGTLMAASGGGSAGQGGSTTSAQKTPAGEIFDGVTMLLMEVAFVMLWAGIAMGAIWADHSWGRPWGWDPKEVFALNTFLVFAVLVHVRLKVKDKGFWTAVLALVGAGVMLFNWVVINFVVTGLHSYA